MGRHVVFLTLSSPSFRLDGLYASLRRLKQTRLKRGSLDNARTMSSEIRSPRAGYWLMLFLAKASLWLPEEHLVIVSLLSEDPCVLDVAPILGALHRHSRTLRAWPRLPTLSCECHSGFFVHCCLPDNQECFLWKAQRSGMLPFLCPEQVLFNGRPRLFWR